MNAGAQPGAARAIVLDPRDDVAVLTGAVEPGQTITLKPSGRRIVAKARIPAGHKVAIRDLEAERHVRKYGEVIGRLTASAACGAHVHVHNLASLRAGSRDLAGTSAAGGGE